MNLIDLKGQRFGRFLAIEKVHIGDNRNARWLCKCDCGNFRVVLSKSLRDGTSKSCGCYRNEAMHELHFIHGQKNTRLYNIYRGMKERCRNKNHVGYKYYGGRSIAICEEWLNDFRLFRDWALVNGYAESLTLDRIDNDKNYCPENCRWATWAEQVKNRRKINCVK